MESCIQELALWLQQMFVLNCSDFVRVGDPAAAVEANSSDRLLCFSRVQNHVRRWFDSILAKGYKAPLAESCLRGRGENLLRAAETCFFPGVQYLVLRMLFCRKFVVASAFC